MQGRKIKNVKPDDVLFINANEHFDKGKRQNRLLPEHTEKIVSMHLFRKEKVYIPAVWIWLR